MSRINNGSDELLRTQTEVEDYILMKIQENSGRGIGPETEFFFVDPYGQPITVDSGQKAFRLFAVLFEAMGYDALPHYEEHDGVRHVVSLQVDGLGNVDLETNYGFEFAARICTDSEDVFRVKAAYFDALRHVEKALDHYAVFQGFMKPYADHKIPIKRSRSQVFAEERQRRFGSAAVEISAVSGATASTQLNFDSCQDAFHEVFRGFLIVEPALTLNYADGSQRSYLRRKVYGEHAIPEILPITEAWLSRNNVEAVHAIVNRLMELAVPFLPNGDGKFQKFCFGDGVPPTVKILMEKGCLTERNLKNILTLFHTHPALRRPAVIELRGVDSLGSPEKIAEFASIGARIAYNDEARGDLLHAFRDFEEADVRRFHDIAVLPDCRSAMHETVAGRRAGEHVQTVVRIGKGLASGRTYSYCSKPATAPNAIYAGSTLVQSSLA